MNLEELDERVHEEDGESAAGKTRSVGRNLAAALGFTFVALAVVAVLAVVVMNHLAYLNSATEQSKISATAYLESQLLSSYEIKQAARVEKLDQLSVVEVTTDFDTGYGDAGTAVVTVGCEKWWVQRCEVVDVSGLPGR